MANPPHHMDAFKTLISPLMKKSWARKLILLPIILTGRKGSNKTDNYENFEPSLISSVEQLSIYVTNIEKSRAFYEKAAGLTHNRTCAPEIHPFNDQQTLRCCYMDTKEQKDSLILIEKRDSKGEVIKPSRTQIFHLAFEIEDGSDTIEFANQLKTKGIKISYGPAIHNDLPPNGDGESGGNHAVYAYDPDFHYVEFFSNMDTIDNFKEKYS